MTGENHLQPLSQPWQLYIMCYWWLKGALCDVMTKDLHMITGNQSIKMSWTAVNFHQWIELPYGVAFVGWPTDIARTNLSKIGGCNILDKLLTKWQTGSMRFKPPPCKETRQA
ncbi:hypothetical protein IEO21_10890 [Rhodonia placenta]|uniref:Uncharacterized protein n=1 Tax=Rhodonia placenta TaxID=104341 RepID=A0A8H7NRW3_9APHY|nr:hypothetical protein IEO21_10890 [Postia placenta]